jgi:hypothetical protein
MKLLIFKILRYSGIPFLMRRIFQRNKVTIILFHEITPIVAEKNFHYLKKYFNIISLQTFNKAI